MGRGGREGWSKSTACDIFGSCLEAGTLFNLLTLMIAHVGCAPLILIYIATHGNHEYLSQRTETPQPGKTHQGAAIKTLLCEPMEQLRTFLTLSNFSRTTIGY